MRCAKNSSRRPRNPSAARAPPSRKNMQPAPRTLFEKIWERHKVVERDGQTLLYIDRHYIHDGSRRAFEMLAEKGLKLRQRRPRTMRIQVDGKLAPGVFAKDIILAIIAKIGAAGATGHVIEYAGSAIRSLSMEGRLTVCNMSIEAGARAGMIAPDETTFAYLDGRPFAPEGAAWDEAVAFWRSLPSDRGAAFDREVQIDASGIAPMATWGTSPEHAAPITGRIPDPGRAGDAERRAGWE